MILGIGIDLCRISRIRRSVDRFGKAWLDEISDEAEQQGFTAHTDLALTAAIAVAVKEAGAKTLGVGMTDGVRWRDIVVTRSIDGIGVQLRGGRGSASAGTSVRHQLQHPRRRHGDPDLGRCICGPHIRQSHRNKAPCDYDSTGL